MRKIYFLLLVILSITANSQVSVSKRHTGTAQKIGDKDFEHFYKTTTVFLFSNVYDTSVYEEVLKQSWTVTPYKIVAIDDFDLSNYLDGFYSFVSIGALKIDRQKSNNLNVLSLYCFFDVYMFNENEKIKELVKLSKKSEMKIKNYNVMVENKINLARFYLYPKAEFIDKIYKESISYSRTIKALFSESQPKGEGAKALINEEMFYNYKPGFLVNYFQKVSQLLKDKQTNWMYAKEAKEELADLKTETLYIPEYLNVKYDPWTLRDSDKTEDEKIKLFSKYNYKFQYITDAEINKKILNTEKFYYLRYVRTNAERFLQVINSKTGEIVYSDYITGLSYQLKADHIEDLSDKIKKVK